MCGLIGIAGKLETKDEKTLQRLLLIDYVRGPDSTGLAAIRNDKTVKISKLCSHPLDLFEMPSFKTALSSYQSSVFLGHNRAATRGVVNTYNAHPFEVDHIVGAHNGTLSQSSQTALEEALGEKYGVDSQALIAAIAKLGIEETIGLLKHTKDGEECPDAWSLVWYNKEDNTLNFLRNKMRPMWYGYTAKFDRIFWASEHPIMDAAIKLSTMGYDIYEEEKTRYRYFPTEVDVWYSYDVDALKAGGETRPKPKAKVVKGKEAVAVPASNPFRRNGSQTGGASGSYSKLKDSTTSSSGRDVITLIGSPSSPYAGAVTEGEFADLAKGGCDWCEADLKFGDVVTICENSGTIRCKNCSQDPVASRIFVSNLNMIRGL